MAGDPTVWHVVVNISKNIPNYIHLQSYSCTFMKVYEGTGTAVVLTYNYSTQYSTSIIRNFNYTQIRSNRQILWKSGFAIRIRAIYLLWKRLGLISIPCNSTLESSYMARAFIGIHGPERTIFIVLHDNNTAILKESPGTFEKCPLFIMHLPRLICTHHPLPYTHTQLPLGNEP